MNCEIIIKKEIKEGEDTEPKKIEIGLYLPANV